MEAFSQVLSKSDLPLVTWLCQSVNPALLFAGQRRALSSPVVLSLVQQLGFDLAAEPALKVAWLLHATAQLDRRDPLVSAHIPAILRDLQARPPPPPFPRSPARARLAHARHG